MPSIVNGRPDRIRGLSARQNHGVILRPMLVSSGPLRPDSDRYAFEVKWDGFRALTDASPDSATIWSRNGHDMTARYPGLQQISTGLSKPVILDAEIVCLDANGKPDFAALWFRSRGSTTPAVCFIAFDIVQLDGRDLTNEPYSG